SSRRRHTRFSRDWSSDVCSSDLTQRDFAGTAPKAARQCKMFFFCGQDEAGASAAAERLVQMLENPGDRVELPGSELKRDPVRLRSEERRVGKERRKRWSRGRGNG